MSRLLHIHQAAEDEKLELYFRAGRIQDSLLLQEPINTPFEADDISTLTSLQIYSCSPRGLATSLQWWYNEITVTAPKWDTT